MEQERASEGQGQGVGRRWRQWTRREVEAHSNMHSAAVVIDNLVYDVTSFLEEHPGGAEVLLDNAGGDASQCFRDVGHSEVALDWRQRFLVGEVVPGERREPAAARVAPAAAAADPLTLTALLNVWGPPALLAALATLCYLYIF